MATYDERPFTAEIATHLGFKPKYNLTAKLPESASETFAMTASGVKPERGPTTKSRKEMWAESVTPQQKPPTPEPKQVQEPGQYTLIQVRDAALRRLPSLGAPILSTHVCLPALCMRSFSLSLYTQGYLADRHPAFAPKGY